VIKEEEVLPNEGASADAHHREEKGKMQRGRPPINIFVLLYVALYTYREGIYSSRGIAKACR
jgi:transposase